MLSGSFIIEINEKNKIEIPSEVVRRLQLNEGDKLEVQIKRIRSKRLDIKISKNPLVKLLALGEERENQ